MLALNDISLPRIILPVHVPAYSRTDVTPAIVHIGVGGFHRAHQAWYLDQLLELPDQRNWGICGVGVLPADRRMDEVMAAQDCLYTLNIRGADGTSEPRVIGSIVEYLHAPRRPDDVISRMSDPATQIVTLTVTEGGYNTSDLTGEFDMSNPAITADLQPDAIPSTTFGLVIAALACRKEQGLAPFTILSCDNIPDNGAVTRTAFTAFAQSYDPALGAWLEQHGAFPNSMVDRITPATTDEDIAFVRNQFGIDDAWPVVAEPFAQWVIEDRFVSGRPRLEDVGAQLVGDVTPYEVMKLRLLNGGHQALCYFGYLAGYRWVHDVAQDPVFAKFLCRYMDTEATRTLPAVPGIDLSDYKRTLIDRFTNAAVGDTITRLCANASNRIPKFVLPVVWDQLRAGGDIACAAAIIASWARYCEGIDENGDPIDIADRLAQQLIPMARRQRDDPTAFLGNRTVFGDLIDSSRFVDAYQCALHSLYTRGARATVAGLAG
ncbi:mannitol dehydrogenase family protein [Mycobacterium montefiorense]|nr:mannitol dehydrogenase family protein [Mycobacterium montefiorense]